MRMADGPLLASAALLNHCPGRRPPGILRDYKEVRMARLVAAAPLDFCQALLEIYTVNDRINQILLEHLDPHAWRAKPPGDRGRTIAAIFPHMHNIRRKWLRLSAPHLKLPTPLDRTRCTQKQVRAALAESPPRASPMRADAPASA